MQINYRYYALIDDDGKIWQDQCDLAISADLSVIERMLANEAYVSHKDQRKWHIISLVMLKMERLGESSYHLVIPRGEIL